MNEAHDRQPLIQQHVAPFSPRISLGTPLMIVILLGVVVDVAFGCLAFEHWSDILAMPSISRMSNQQGSKQAALPSQVRELHEDEQEIASHPWTDGEFFLAGHKYTALSSTVGDLLENGWTVDWDQSFVHADANGDYMINGTCKPSDYATGVWYGTRQEKLQMVHEATGQQISIDALNVTGTCQGYEHCLIANIGIQPASSSDFFSEPWVIAGGANPNSTYADIVSNYGTPDTNGGDFSELSMAGDNHPLVSGMYSSVGRDDNLGTTTVQYAMLDNNVLTHVLIFNFSKESGLEWVSFRNEQAIDADTIAQWTRSIFADRGAASWQMSETPEHDFEVLPPVTGTVAEMREPAGMWSEGEFSLDGRLYKLYENTVADFFANGWRWTMLSEHPENLLRRVDCNGQYFINPGEQEKVTFYLPSRDLSIECWCENNSTMCKSLFDCVIARCDYSPYSAYSPVAPEDLSFAQLPQGIQIGSTSRDAIIAAYGEPEKLSEDRICYSLYADDTEAPDDPTSFSASYQTTAKLTLWMYDDIVTGYQYALGENSLYVF